MLILSVSHQQESLSQHISVSRMTHYWCDRFGKPALTPVTLSLLERVWLQIEHSELSVFSLADDFVRIAPLASCSLKFTWRFSEHEVNVASCPCRRHGSNCLHVQCEFTRKCETMGLESKGFMNCHHPPSPSPHHPPSPSPHHPPTPSAHHAPSPSRVPPPTTPISPQKIAPADLSTVLCTPIHSLTRGIPYRAWGGNKLFMEPMYHAILLEGPCASQEGASMLLRKGGFLGREGEGVRPSRRPSLCPPDFGGKRTIERALKNTLEASESGIRLVRAHLL